MLLPILAKIAIAGSLTLSATALGAGQQYLQLDTQIEDDFTSVQRALNTHHDQIDSLGAVILQNHRVLDLTAQQVTLTPYWKKNIAIMLFSLILLGKQTNQWTQDRQGGSYWWNSLKIFLAY